MNPDVFIDRLRIEAAHLSGNADPGSDAFRMQVATTLLAWVPIYLSSGIYSSLLASGTPPAGLLQTLDIGAGICGHQVELAVTALESLGIPWRDVQIFYEVENEARNHTVVEIEWASAWRMVDVTWGFIPHEGDLGSAMSWESAAAKNHRQGLHNHSVPWRANVEKSEDVFSYLKPNADLVLYSGSGDFTIPIRPGNTDLPHKNVVRTGSWRHLLSMRSSGVIRLVNEEGIHKVALQCVADHPGTLRLGEHSLSIEAGPQLLEVIVGETGEHMLTFVPESTIGAVVVETLEVSRLTTDMVTAPIISSRPAS